VNQLVPITERTPALIAAAGNRASYRFFEFFAAQIRSQNSGARRTNAATSSIRSGDRVRAVRPSGIH
jgi:hypothetical protein